jgi:Transposase DDE domain
LAYVGIIPCDYPIRLPSGAAIRADQAVADAVFERRSCGNGSKGPRYSDWAMTATAVQGQYLLIRRLLSRPDSYTFYLCWAPPDRPATMTYFITIAGRRWPVETTFETGKDVFGWDQTQVRSRDGICRHTALAALAQLRAAAIRNTITGSITLPADTDTDTDTDTGDGTSDTSTATGGDGCDGGDGDGGDGGDGDGAVSDADLQIPLGDAPVPVRAGQPCPPELGPIKLSIAETTRLTGLAACHTKGLIARARLAFALRWSLRRRLHQARARWHHYSTRLQAVTDTG